VAEGITYTGIGLAGAVVALAGDVPVARLTQAGSGARRCGITHTSAQRTSLALSCRGM
jgi:hypothetical protein